MLFVKSKKVTIKRAVMEEDLAFVMIQDQRTDAIYREEEVGLYLSSLIC